MIFEPLSFNITEPSIDTLDTGLEFWKIADHTLPLITLIVDIDVGASSEPADKFGVSDMTASTLIRGGTENETADEFTRKTELFGFEFNARSAAEFTQISVTCLAKDMNPAMMMLMDIIKNPRFDQAQLELVRDEQIEQIKRVKQVPFFQAFNTLNKRLFGEDHPRARVPSEEILNSITQDDLFVFHKNYFQPDISRFAVIGAVDAAAYDQLKRILASWKGKAVGNTVTPDAKPISLERTVILVDRPGTQTVVGFGHLGLKPDHPDRYILEVFNEIYGGSGLSSRLMNKVRTQKGLAYVVFGAHMFDVPRGIYVAVCMTSNKSVVEALQTIIEITEELQKTPVPQDELNRVIESMENSFIFKFDQPRRILQRTLVYKRMGMAPDYLAKYLDNIRAVTPEKIMQAAKDHIDLNKIQIIVVGPADTLKPELEKLGWPIEVIEKE
ncbi:insulinase family protein, partial [bacterium]|nr:insulinase family protein [bacterium]